MTGSTDTTPTARERISRRHLFIIAALVLAALGAALLILRPAQPGAGGAPAAASAGHAHGGEGEAGHQDGHQEHKEGGKDDHQDGHADEDKDGHKDEGKGEDKDGHKDEPAARPAPAAAGAHAGEAPGAVEMTEAQLQAAGIRLATSGPARIASVLRFPGEIRLNEDRTAHIVPRVAGVVQSVSASAGQRVARGQVLAVLSSNAVSDLRAEWQTAQRRRALAATTYEREKKLWDEGISAQQDMLAARQALQEADIALANAAQKLRALGAAPDARELGRVELRAPFDGVVVERHLTLGEAVREDANAFTIADLSSVWAELSIAARELPQVRVGERVQVRAGAFEASAPGTVSYVGALIGEQTRTATARVTLPNAGGVWRPGLYVNVEVLAQESAAAVAVENAALQTEEGTSVVFVRTPTGFAAQPVRLGRSDGRHTEVLQGLAAGVRYAADGSFVVKSERGKGSAAHEH